MQLLELLSLYVGIEVDLPDQVEPA